MNLNNNEFDYLELKYFRQRSSTCDTNWCRDCKEDQREIYLGINLRDRRRSLGYNIKLATIISEEKEINSNQLIIGITVF
jgi:hypothetical protein